MNPTLRGLTLIEVLAAITVLGLLAATIVPVSWRLGQSAERLADHWRAVTELEQTLLTMDLERIAAVSTPLPLFPQRPEGPWILTRRLTSSAAMPSTMLPHGWLRITITRDARSDSPILAERLVATSSRATP